VLHFSAELDNENWQRKILAMKSSSLFDFHWPASDRADRPQQMNKSAISV
jgi:hypothetical protein